MLNLWLLLPDSRLGMSPRGHVTRVSVVIADERLCPEGRKFVRLHTAANMSPTVYVRADMYENGRARYSFSFCV